MSVVTWHKPFPRDCGAHDEGIDRVSSIHDEIHGGCSTRVKVLGMDWRIHPVFPTVFVFFLVGEVVASEIAVQPLHLDTDTALRSLYPVSSCSRQKSNVFQHLLFLFFCFGVFLKYFSFSSCPALPCPALPCPTHNTHNTHTHTTHTQHTQHTHTHNTRTHTTHTTRRLTQTRVSFSLCDSDVSEPSG